MSWARLLKRVFEIDMEHCSQCGGMGGDVAVACGQRLEGTGVVDLVGRQGSKQQLAIRSKTAAGFATNATQLAFFIGRASD
jgi:hypothetical protein